MCGPRPERSTACRACRLCRNAAVGTAASPPALAFSILVNDVDESSVAKRLQDAIVEALVALPRLVDDNRPLSIPSKAAPPLRKNGARKMKQD